MRLSLLDSLLALFLYTPFPVFLDSLYLHVGFGLVVGAMVCFLLLNCVFYRRFVVARLFLVLFVGGSGPLQTGFASLFPCMESAKLLFRPRPSFSCLASTTPSSPPSSLSPTLSPSVSTGQPCIAQLNLRFVLSNPSKLSTKLFLGSTLRLLLLSSHLSQTPPSLTCRRFIRDGHRFGSRLCSAAWLHCM